MSALARVLILALVGVAGAIQPLAAAPSRAVLEPDADALARARASAAKADTLPHARYAWPIPVEADAARDGRWGTLADGRLRWRLDVHSPGARSLELAIGRLFLPHGAELTWGSADGKQRHGPWRAADVAARARLATPLVFGDSARLEAIVPAAQRVAFALVVEQVLHGERDPFAQPKSAGCHIDAICETPDAAGDQVRSVARYTVGGSACTGQLLSDTARDGRLYFITAAHCVDSDAEAQGIVLYWRYENATCRVPGSSENSVPVPIGNAIVQTGGATLRATYAPSDASLLELNAPIPAGVDPYFNGWDRRPSPPTGAFAIHHAGGDEKRISTENGALTTLNKPVLETPGVFGSRLLRVPDWDQGSMQAGSDGGGLFNPERRFIGQYAGGPGACGNNLESYFGRFSSAWEGGGSAATRMRDWLDPVGTNPEFFDGQATGCTAGNAQLDVSSDPIAAGDPVTFTLNLSGGTPPFDVEWDIDGDGTFDRFTGGVGAGSTSVTANFPAGQGVVAFARATDAGACAVSASRALSVSGPSIEVTPSAPVQVCGDDDEQVEPGERWRIPTTFRNAGGGVLGEGIATLSKRGTESVDLPLGPDTYGNRAGDNFNGCGYRFVDLDPLVEPQPLTVDPDSGSFPEDEAVGSVINVTPFDFYGTQVSTLVMSVNGYLSTSPAEQGGDYSNQCGLVPPENGSAGGRFNVMWDDLQLRPAATGSGLRHVRFEACPRRAESSAAQTACHVFQWSRVGLFTGVEEPDGDFDLQAIVYPASGQIVYQYRRTPPDQGGSASISIRNNDVTDGLEYACYTEGAVVDERSLCFFNPNFPPATSNVPAVRMETPAIALDNLAPGASVTRDVRFAVAQQAACGNGFEITYAGTVDRKAHSILEADLLSTTIGGGSPCQIITGCQAAFPQITPRDGLFANPNRFGNGVGAFNIAAGPRTIFFGAWFTGRIDRSPTWLILQGPIADAQAIMPVLRFRQLIDEPAFAVESNVVGKAVLTYLSPTEYALVWDVDGVAAGERQSRLYATTTVTPNRTGAWYYPAESGWGQVLDDHVSGAGTEQVIINYLYDAGGEPVWTLGGSAGLGGGTQPQNTFLVHCLYCPVFPDFGNTSAAAGSLTRNFQTITTGTLTTAIVYPPPLFGEWTRDAVPIQMLTQPQQ